MTDDIEKSIPWTTRIINMSLRKPKLKKVRVLLDSGGSATIMHASLAKNLRIKRSNNTVLSTITGRVSTATMTKIWFTLPEFVED